MFEKGAEWRRWDLHVHTKGTNKNDQFTSPDFDSFCRILFKEALNNSIGVIGITDYFSINNYLKVVEYRKVLQQNKDFSKDEISEINKILLLPNVELRMLPVTDCGKLVNIHCIFNPEYIDSLENDFFTSITFNSYKMNRQGLIDLGKDQKSITDEIKAYEEGINSFVVSTEQLQKALDNSRFRENTLIVVSNSNKDGASGLQKHYKLFEGENGSLDAIRRYIYKISDFIFSSNQKDIYFFSGRDKDGKETNESKKTVIEKCGSLKPCIHGSDAHEESKLFKPDNDRYCWIKADPTFDGLKQVLNEPIDRVYIGEEPPLFENIRNNSTKFINSLSITPIDGYSGQFGKWFNDRISFNKELVAVIGNKGNGKSAIADIIALCCNYNEQNNFAFLKKGKFRDGNLAQNFEAEIKIESGLSLKKNLNDNVIQTVFPLVKYLPQGYFESLCNDFEKIEKFQEEIESVVFQYIDETQRLGKSTFKELITEKTNAVNESIIDLKGRIESINKGIITLEKKENIKYLEGIKSQIEQKEIELKALIKPEKVDNPNDDPKIKEKNKSSIEIIENIKKEIDVLENKISNNRNELTKIYRDVETLTSTRDIINNQFEQFRVFKEQFRETLSKHDINIDNVIEVKFDLSVIENIIREKNSKILELKNSIGETNKTETSFLFLLDKEKELLKTESDKLGEPQKKYQKYLQDIESWKKLKAKIEGSEEEPNTLNWLKKEATYVKEQLSNDISSKMLERTNIVKQIFDKKQEIISIYRGIKNKIDTKIEENKDLLGDYGITIEASLSLSSQFQQTFFKFINQQIKGSFKGISDANIVLNKIFENKNINSKDDIINFLNMIIKYLKEDINKDNDPRYVDDQVSDMLGFYNFLFSLDYIESNYQLKQGNKNLETLSPGEKGALLLIFYLLLDMDNKPLILDQPEDNLDNESVANILVNFIKQAKKKRQIIMITHNPNLAVVADAEQIIYVSLDKKGGNEFSFESGSIESSLINKHIVDVLEGAMPAFRKREKKYFEKK